MNVNNIYNFTSNKLLEENVYYYIQNKTIRLSANLLAIKDSKILTYSNEWLSLLKNAYYPNNGPYREIVRLYFLINMLKNKAININDSVITFITSFSHGTVHGYAGFFYILFEYMRNKEKYKNYKIIFLKNAQSGIRQILQNAINKNIIDKNKIIYIDPDKLYLIKELLIIPNKYHTIMGTKLADDINNYVKKYFSHMRTIDNYKKLNLGLNLKNVCIIKNNLTNNTNNEGSYNNNDLIKFSEKNNVYILDPGKISEISVILAINTCKIFICSWGTAFMKNYCYISENCKKIIVLVHHKKYLKEYNSHLERNVLVKKYKNANIIYKIRSDLDFIFDQ